MHPALVGLYIYFRSDADDAVVLGALRDAGRRLAASGWPAPTLWRRPTSDSSARTWMQVHATQPAGRIDALLSAIDRAAADSGLEPLISGAWHIECFESCG